MEKKLSVSDIVGPAINKETKIEEFWSKMREDFTSWMGEYKAGIDGKLHNAQIQITKLENQNVLLAKEVVRLRKRDAQIEELMGFKK